MRRNLTSEGVQQMLANIPAHGLKVWKPEQVCCAQSLFYFICSDRKKRKGWPMKKPSTILLRVRRQTEASSHRSCMSMLRLCRKFPPNAKQSTGVKTAWIHPEADNYRTKNHHYKSNCNFSVIWDIQTKIFFKWIPECYSWQKQRQYLLGWRGCFLALVNICSTCLPGPQKTAHSDWRMNSSTQKATG